MDKLIQNPEVKTFGCRLNFWESEIIRDQLVKNEIFEKLIIFNTCSVTEEAERKVKISIRQMKRNKPEAKIIVTGCAAQISPKKWLEMPEVNFVVGNVQNHGINNIHLLCNDGYVVCLLMMLQVI